MMKKSSMPAVDFARINGFAANNGISLAQNSHHATIISNQKYTDVAIDGYFSLLWCSFPFNHLATFLYEGDGAS